MTAPKRTKWTEEQRDGSIIEKRLARHRDGAVSIKSKRLSCPVPKPQPEPEPPMTDEEKVADWNRQKEERRRAEREAMKRKKLEPKTAAPKTIKERMHHDWTGDKSIIANTTNRVPRLLKRLKITAGSHVERFQRDYEIAGADVRSPDLIGAPGGGNGLPLPLNRIEAARRLNEFRESKGEESFLICEAVLIHGAQPSEIHARGGPENKVVSELIRISVNKLAEFYTPSRTRPNRALAAFARYIEEQKRRVKL